MAVFEHRQAIPRPVETVFDFFTRTENLMELSSPDMGLMFTSAPDVITQGARLEFRVQGFGQVREIIHEVVEFERPRRFREEMVDGPMPRWVHEHVFEAVDGEAVVYDRIDFEPPGGILGIFLTENKILDSLEDGFLHRERVVERMLREGLIS
ncbi:Polyketide cyclase / dehydrase and lipid transport [Maioricimonas rarisocia]|uniref:Polyketide cyclase / dehydrase and lipid transport n=1 Tax=Maioricimonas rarisocia TaxID=2528026 RepID=A0A517Z4P2_9PLAN|nr:SRPBCC family protein [Maioricimonas rarisocia]QDU37450.1 Polyketide cyclase / dehydrase and lipid transport [Maioricimonas rarisocia]